MKTYTLEQLTDQYVGESGTTEREQFEQELRLDIETNGIYKDSK